MTGRIHAARVRNSARLRRCFDVLVRHAHRGVTSWQGQVQARTVAWHSCVAELRAGGIAVVCRREGRRWRYWLKSLAPRKAAA